MGGMKASERLSEWLGLRDYLQDRQLRKYGHEHEIGQVVERRMEIRCKKPDPWIYQGKVRLLRIEKQPLPEREQYLRNALRKIAYNLQGKEDRDLARKASLLDRALERGWYMTAEALLEGVDLQSIEDPPDSFRPKGYRSLEEQVKAWKGSAMYHYELVRPRRGTPKTFVTLDDIFKEADHEKFEFTYQGQKSKARLFNVVAAFAWLILTVTTEVLLLSVQLTGSISSAVANYWLIPSTEGVFFAFVLYFVVKAVMGNMYVFQVELLPLSRGEGPSPSLAINDKTVSRILDMAQMPEERIQDLAETIYSFQESVFSELRTENTLLRNENAILEEKLKEEAEKASYLIDTGRVTTRRVVPRWAYISALVAAVATVLAVMGI